MLCACSDRVDVVWEDADPVDSLIDRVAAARALALRDAGFALDLIAYGEYGIALELVCTQIDEHDSLPSPEELEALRDLGLRLGVDVDGFFRFLGRPDETIPEEYLVWTDWECRSTAFPEQWSQQDANAFISTMLRSPVTRDERMRITGRPPWLRPRNGTPPLYWIRTHCKQGPVCLAADLRRQHRQTVTRNRVLLPDTAHERQARRLLLQTAKISHQAYWGFVPIMELIGAGEWEVALMVLCTQLCDTRAALRPEDLATIHAAGEHLCIDTDALLAPTNFLDKRVHRKKRPWPVGKNSWLHQ